MWSHGKDFAIIEKFFPKQMTPILAVRSTYLLTLHLMLFPKRSFTYCVRERKYHESMGLIWMLPFYLFFPQTYGDLVTKTSFL